MSFGGGSQRRGATEFRYQTTEQKDKNPHGPKRTIVKNTEGAEVEYFPKFMMEPGEAQRLFKILEKEIPWQRESVKLNDQYVKPPRLVAVLGDEGTHYQYNNSTKVATGWHSELLPVKNKIEELTGQKYNFALLNLYRDGQDSIGAHSDSEKDIVADSTIASLSLGATRDFYLQNKQTDNEIKVALNSGSLLLMKGKCQKLYRHYIPKDSRVRTPRINLTFRLVHMYTKIEQLDEKIKMVTILPREAERQPEEKIEQPQINNKPKPTRSRLQGGPLGNTNRNR